jgi:hypothetical protein
MELHSPYVLLLFSLSNKPLQRGRILAPQAPTPSAAEQAAAAAEEAALASEESDSDEVSSSWLSESDLSEWDDREVESGKEVETGAGTYGGDSLTAIGAAEGEQGPGQPPSPELTQVVTNAKSDMATVLHPRTPEACPPSPRTRTTSTPKPSASAAGRLHMPSFPAMPVAPQREVHASMQQQAVPLPSDLQPCLAGTRLQALPFMAPQPGKCLTAQYITHQVCASARPR